MTDDCPNTLFHTCTVADGTLRIVLCNGDENLHLIVSDPYYIGQEPEAEETASALNEMARGYIERKVTEAVHTALRDITQRN